MFLHLNLSPCYLNHTIRADCQIMAQPVDIRKGGELRSVTLCCTGNRGYWGFSYVKQIFSEFSEFRETDKITEA